MKKMLILFLIIFPVSYAEAQTPSQVYEEYNDRIIAGLSFEERLPYFSERRSAAMQNSLNETMKKYDMPRSEAIDALIKYPTGYVRCLSMSLVEEEITDNQATMTYANKDICDRDPALKIAQKRVITMVDEEGWKIDKIQMRFVSGP